MDVFTFDVETSIHNKGNPYDTRNLCVSIHTKADDGTTVFSYHTDPGFVNELRRGFLEAKLIVGQNLKFDLAWARNLGLTVPYTTKLWCTMLAEYILSGQTNSFASLNSLCELYGLELKTDAVKEYWDAGVSTEHVPQDVLAEYGNRDVDLTYQVYLKQLSDPRMTPKVKRLIELSCADMRVLHDMEYHGLHYDVELSKELAAKSLADRAKAEEELMALSDFGPFNLDSDRYLSMFLYGGRIEEPVIEVEESIFKSGAKKGQVRTINRVVGSREVKSEGFFNPLKGSELKAEGFFSTATDTLGQLKATTKKQKQVITLLQERAKANKLYTAYYQGLLDLIETMHWGNGVLHGQYNQVIARTGRLSCSKPNLQNTPGEVDHLLTSRYKD